MTNKKKIAKIMENVTNQQNHFINNSIDYLAYIFYNIFGIKILKCNCSIHIIFPHDYKTYSKNIFIVTV